MYFTESKSRKLLCIFIAIFIVLINFSAVKSNAVPVGDVDLAEMGVVIFSSSSDTVENASVGLPKNAFDNDITTTRWATGDTAGAYIQADFPIPVTVKSFKITECTTWGNITSYVFQYWNGTAWVAAYTGNTTVADVITLSAPVITTKCRVYVNSVDSQRYQGVTIWDIDINGTYDVNVWPPVSSGGGCTYNASTSEPGDYGPANAFDSSTDTRWASTLNDAAGAFLAVNFGADIAIDRFFINECVIWGNITSYSAQAFVENDWVTVYTGTTTSSEIITLDTPVTTSQFRILVNSVDQTRYNGVTIYELTVLAVPEEGTTNPQTGDMYGIVFFTMTIVSALLFTLAKKQSFLRSYFVAK